MTRRVGFAIRVLGAVAALLLVTACAVGSHGDETKADPLPIDLRTGSVGGVALGDPGSSISAAFGTGKVSDPEAEDYDVDTDDEPYYGPTGITYGGNGATVRFHEYPEMFFDVVSGHVLVIEVTQPGAVTAEGVGIGDSLEDVQAAYPDTECFVANEDTEYREYPACLGHAGSRYNVWFGGDPVRNITITSAPLG